MTPFLGSNYGLYVKHGHSQCPCDMRDVMAEMKGPVSFFTLHQLISAVSL